ncbi:MAG: S41 family peptidase [bacterium]|nr:S41 family peptidase [bacterium]
MRRLRPAAPFLRPAIAALLVAAAAAWGAPTPTPPAAGGAGVYRVLDVLCDVMGIIQRDYIEPVGTETLVQYALRGMLSSLDPYSHLVPAAAAPAAAEPPGTYGLEVAYGDRLLRVVSPVEGGPAWRAGVRSGDVVLKIDGEAVEERQLVELRDLFRGGAADLAIEVARRGERDLLTFTLKPGTIEGPPARAEKLDADIGLLRIGRFDDGTAAGAASCLGELAAGGAGSLVLDLRDCPAGDVEAAVAVADLLLPEGAPIASLTGRVEGVQREFVSVRSPAFEGRPIVVLVNGGTSGAAEVLAGALRADRRGLLMGAKSFGSAFEERSFPLKDGSSLVLIAAVYRTPDGRLLQGEGLAVDVEVPPPAPAGEREGGGRVEEEGPDPVVRRAVDLIKGIRIIGATGGVDP